MVWTLHSPRASSLRMDCSDGGHVERHGSGQARWRSGAGGQGSRQGSRPHPGTYLRRSTTSGRAVREDREVSYYVEVQCTTSKYSVLGRSTGASIWLLSFFLLTPDGYCSAVYRYK